MVQREMSRITCIIHHRMLGAFIRTLEANGIRRASVQTGRMMFLQNPERQPFLGTKSPRLIDQPSQIVSFYTSSDRERALIAGMAAETELNIPGRGSVLSRRVQLYTADEEQIPEPAHQEGEAADTAGVHLFKGFTDIQCIVPVGQGSAISRIALELGICVPTVTYGEGTGLRDKLGLLRITIPAQKEIVHLLVPTHDAAGILNLLVDEGKLNQPGKGFLFLVPQSLCLPNTRLNLGRQQHAASIEQIIAAIDDLRGSMQWRRRFGEPDDMPGRRGVGFIRNMLKFSVTCEEGRAGKLTDAALTAGVSGATTEKARVIRPGDESKSRETHARERITFVMDRNLEQRILEVMVEEGLFRERTAGEIEIAPAPFVYYSRRT